MVKCETCEHVFEKGNNFKYHKKTSVQKFLACFISNEDLQNQIYKRRQFGAINARKEWHCEFQNRCIECDKRLGCKAKYNRHWNRKHKLEWTETFPLKHLEKFEEASVNRKHNGNITLCKKPLIPTRPQMILIKALTEVRRVKKCFDRAVDDIFFSLYNG